MRISDWSSDVCSSDLFGQRQPAVFGGGFFLAQRFELFRQRGEAGVVAGEEAAVGEFGFDGRHLRLVSLDPAGEEVVVALVLVAEFPALLWNRPTPGPARMREGGFPGLRSEEHKYELQSLMRIS